MKHVPFYIRQSFSQINRNRQRTLFVLFCIAVGVAAVVSLRTLGLMVAETLTGNLQAENRGDVVVNAPNPLQFLAGGDAIDPTLIENRGILAPATFSQRGIDQITAWATERGFETTMAIRSQASGRIRPIGNGEGGLAAETATIYAVEPEHYPFYREITFVAPAGATFATVLNTPQSLVLSERLAKTLELNVGDRVLMAGPEPLTITGIVEESSDASLLNPSTYLFPYAYVAYEAGAQLFATKADTIYLRLPAGTDVAQTAAELGDSFPGISLNTTEDLREVNSVVSDSVTRFVTTMGLVALLIGGIGIVNTMIVVVSRRGPEIAVLKTIGLQGNQITLMFLIEAFIFGILGSLLGLLLGLGLVFVLRQVVEVTFSQSLKITIFPEALLMGLVTGVLVTMVFGFLPTIAAGRIRPSAVLRPSETIMPSSGRFLTLFLILLLTGIIGILVGLVLDNYLLGLLLSYGAMFVIGIATFFFWILAVVFSRLPSFGSIYLKLAQRALGANAGRTASTLLALVVGMFALSLILLMTRGLINIVNDLLESQLGGNMIVSTESVAAGELAESALLASDAVQSFQTSVEYTGEIVAINGDSDMESLLDVARANGRIELFGEESSNQGAPFSGGGLLAGLDPVGIQLDLFVQALVMQRASEYDLAYEPIRGTALEPGNLAGVPGMVLQEGPASRWLGLDIGDTLTIRFGNEAESVLEVVGLLAEPETAQVNISTGSTVSAIIADNAFPATVEPSPPSFIAEVDPEQIPATINALSEIDGVYAIDISQLSEIIGRLFNQIATLPLVVAILALFASSIIIANTVSLATLESRREIGIMKALGLSSSSILNLLLLENGLVGLAGGLIGVGIGASFLFLSGIFTDSLSSFPLLTLLALVLLAVGLTLLATLVTAYGAARETPMIVLRYE